MFRNKRELIDALVPVGTTVLDVGFWGQATGPESTNWVHALLAKRAGELWGIDLDFDERHLPGPVTQYARMSAENFKVDRCFDIIFAGDLIEHLVNPGQFLDVCKRHLEPGGVLVLTTPNAFNLFNLAEKLTKDEPTVNSDHTCYFNRTTLSRLLAKTRWKVDTVDYLYTLGPEHRESMKKKVLNAVYALLSRRTTKFIETLVVVASPC